MRRVGLRVGTRLTLLYAALFLAGGALLVAGMVVTTRQFLFAPVPVNADSDELRRAGKAAVLGRTQQQLRGDAVGSLLVTAGVELAALTVLSAAAGIIVSRRMLGRVRRVTDAARAASETSLHGRLHLPGPRDEIKELGDTFDAMLARLDEAFEAQRRFAANASHELRTPLTVTRTAAEVTLAKPDATVAQLRAMAAEVVAAMGRAQRLVDSLLLLARSEQRQTATEAEDLADLARDALDHATEALSRRRIRTRTDLARAPVRGEVSLLSRAVANLVENAVRHNREGGEIEFASGTDAGASWIRVTNTGQDMSTADVGRLFEPFNRGERTRLDDDGGAGLGLSIVAAVAWSHGGTVAATARPAADGGGLSLVLRLPRDA